jgi:metallopeptidase MepB
VKDATFKNVMVPLAEDENTAALSSHILGFYQAVSADKSLRDASTKADEMLDEFSIESSMNEDVYKLVDAVYKKKEALDPESQRLLEKERKNFIKYGLGIPEGPKRDRFKEIKMRLSQIAIKFQKTLNEEHGGIWFTPEELEGLPDDVMSTLAKGEGENAGKVRVTFKYPDLFPTMKYVQNPDTRFKMLIGNENRCNENVPIFAEAILLRDEAARLLGYPNHATFRIEDKMAKTPEFVDKFLGDLRTRLTPGGKEELKVLAELKKKDLESKGKEFNGSYYTWDHQFYSRLQLQQDYKLDQQKVSEYFPLQTTLSKMLEIFEQLLGLEFVELTGKDRDNVSPTGKGDDIVWHPDVQLFSVWNDESEGKGFVGYLYTDLHPRDGK